MHGTTEANDDPRIDHDERRLYVFLGYMTVAFTISALLTRRFVPDLFANAVTVFVVIAGLWFVDEEKRARMSLPKWMAVSAVAGAVAFALSYALR